MGLKTKLKKKPRSIDNINWRILTLLKACILQLYNLNIIIIFVKFK